MFYQFLFKTKLLGPELSPPDENLRTLSLIGKLKKKIGVILFSLPLSLSVDVKIPENFNIKYYLSKKT